MGRLRVAVIWLAMLGLLAAPSGTRAQEQPLPVTPGAGKYLPAATEFGSGWTDVWQGGIDPGAELFKEGVKAVYGGPNGARAIIFVWVIQDSTTAVRRSWESTTEIFDSYRYEFADDYDYSAAKTLDSVSAPLGCVEASRAEGSASKQQFPGGLTLCAVDPDVIILAIASGTINDQQGYLASDALVQMALDQATAATPTD
jgi:hypothetical protein